ncbi:MAG: PorT family protein [Chitinophagaceae bacterium]|nr:PorT family protein [Chitinophagaceae bacterium]
MIKTGWLAGMAMLLSSITVNAQETRWGITAGPMFVSLRSKIDDYKDKTDLKLSFTAGVVADIVFNESFSIQPGLHFIQKGGRDIMETISLQLNYAELSANGIYSMGETRNSLFIGAGPTLSMGISGKLKDYYPGAAVPPVNIKFGNNENEDHFKKFEIGANVLAGFHINRNFFVTALYNFGLSNLFINRTEDGRLTNRYWGIKAGWLFGR